MRAVFAGCGFLGEAAAGLFLEAGWEVLGLSRTGEPRGARFEVRAADIALPLAAAADWRGPDLLVQCVSTRGGDAAAYRRVYPDGLRNLLDAFAPRRVVFVSSTSVYGQTGGEWVSEDSPAEPQAETSRILLEAEQAALGAGGVALRLAGLYGPGRSVLLDRFLSGTARLDNGGGRWINQIHREDAAAAVFHASRLPPGIYNVCDDTPATLRAVYGWIAGALGVPLPPEGSGAPRRRGASNKRVSSRKLRSQGWAPRFPAYRDALPRLLAAARSSAIAR